MAIFTNKTDDVSVDFGIGVNESFEYGMNAHYDIFMESLEDDMLVLESMYQFDMAELAYARAATESVEEVEETSVALEASVKEFYNRVKESVKAFFGKIIKWLTGIIDRVRAVTMDGAAFADKFADKVKNAKIPSGGLKVKGYNYNVEHLFDKGVANAFKETRADKKYAADIVAAAFRDSDPKKLDAEISSTEAGDVYEYIALKVKSSASNSSEADEDLHNYFYGAGSKRDGKVEITVKSVSGYLPYLKKSTGLVNDLKSAKTIVEKEGAALIRAIESGAKEAEKASKEKSAVVSKQMKLVSVAVQDAKNQQSANVRFINAWIGALKSYVGFAKSVCLAATRA